MTLITQYSATDSIAYDIAAVLYNKKSGGCATTGNQTYPYPIPINSKSQVSSPFIQNINWILATKIYLYIQVTLPNSEIVFDIPATSTTDNNYVVGTATYIASQVSDNQTFGQLGYYLYGQTIYASDITNVLLNPIITPTIIPVPSGATFLRPKINTLPPTLSNISSVKIFLSPMVVPDIKTITNWIDVVKAGQTIGSFTYYVNQYIDLPNYNSSFIQLVGI